MPTTAYIALGSNLGDRARALNAALEALRQEPGIAVTRVSSYRETEPVGGPPGQANYLNAVAELSTELEPCKLLQTLLGIEARLGRVRAEHHGPRTLDLDLLLYGDQVLRIHEPGCVLLVPHPRMHERGFVLEPLAEIAPNVVHPGVHRTAAELLQSLGAGVSRPLAGLRAVVTGSTSGIGRAIALAFASAGAELVIHGHRSAKRAELVARAAGSEEFVLADLREEAGCKQLVESAWQRPVGVWVNNAGADVLTGEKRTWPYERKLQALWEVDVLATMRLSREVGKRMQARGRGAIVNMGWDQAETGMEGDSGELFAATKGAVMAFSRSLALSLAPQVRVNCLAPGWIRTAWGEQASQSWQDRVLRETPAARWGMPEDVAQAALWLASPSAGYITGQIIRVNGGAVRS